jgi:hypothetical protein
MYQIILAQVQITAKSEILSYTIFIIITSYILYTIHIIVHINAQLRSIKNNFI